MSNKNLPLNGVKVVEMSTHVAVPNVARFLADWGADVIKVENITGDPWRSVGKNHFCPVEDDENPVFAVQNANKKFIGMNLKSETGLEMFKKMVSDADIFITSLREKALIKLGIDGKTLTKEFPKLVYVSFNGYGQKGPDAGLPGYDTVGFWGRPGAFIDWTMKGHPPFNAATGAGDAMSGSILTAGVLAALYGAKTTGKGTIVHSSLYGAGIWYNSFHVLSTQFGNELPKDENKPNNPLGYSYECKNGEWVFVSIPAYDKQFPELMDIIGLSEYRDDERFCKITNVHSHIEEFMPLIKGAILKMDRADFMQKMEEHNIVCGALGKIKDVATDEQAIANGYVTPVTFPNGDTVMMPTNPVRFSNYDESSYEVPTVIGRDTDEILQHFGYSADEIEKAKADGAIK